MGKSKNIDATEGPLLKNCILFALPLIATGLLQLLYNAADMVVVAKYAGGSALAAVGTCSAIISLHVNLFMGLSTGANIIVARHYGAKNKKAVFESVHSAVLLSVLAGFTIMLVGVIFAGKLLNFMACPSDVFLDAKTYLVIYMLGIPASSIYNFGAAILRSVGDTKKPLYILIFSGLINISLNLLLVVVFNLSVAGVAIATSVSQLISATVVIIILKRTTNIYKLYLLKLKLYKDKAIDILRFGVLAGLQSCCFSISNIIIQSSINSFGTAAIAGSAAATNIEGLTHTAMNSIVQTDVTFVSQNYGALNKKRINRTFRICLMLVTVAGILMASLTLLFNKPLLSLFTASSSANSAVSAQEIMRYGLIKMIFINGFYFICGISDVISGTVRGLGVSLLPTIVTLIFTCGFRIFWVYTIFNMVSRTIYTLFLSYPISWLLAGLVHYICLIYIRKKRFKTWKEQPN